jgi:imidazolonepropionase-like amidohydrolase
MLRWVQALAGAVVALAPMAATAQEAPKSPFIRYAQPIIAFTHVKLVDGTGSPARDDMTVLVKDGRISAVGPAARTPVPTGATVIDGKGKTVLPGFVMMHEHMFYPAGATDDGYLNFTEMLHSFPPLYLAGGVTTLRTAGSLNAYADLSLRDAVAAGRIVGADMDVTAPYLDAPGLPVHKIHGVKSPADAEHFVNYWADEGATSLKAYMFINRATLKAGIDAAHKRGMKVTGHLCSVTYREAADLGIDNLEHGFFASSDTVPGKTPDTCPLVGDYLAALDPESAVATDLIKHLVDRKVALTSTLPVFEQVTVGRPKLTERAMSVMSPTTRQNYEAAWTAGQGEGGAKEASMKKEMRLERRFVEAGGVLMSGTDPTGNGGVLPGFANRRQVQLLVEAGFSFEQAIKISTLNGATFMGRQMDVGSVEVGKRADLILIDGDPTKDVGAMDHMPTVFKAGVGYDTEAIIDSMKGAVGPS